MSARAGAAGGSAPWPLILAFAAALSAMAAAYEFGVLNAGRAGTSGPAGESRSSEIARLNSENRELSEQVTRLQTNEKINREAYQRIEAELGTLQDKIIEQQEDLSFYRGVVGGSKGAEVRIQKLVVSPDHIRSKFHLQLTLAQSRRAEKPVSGSLGIRVDGSDGSRPVSLELPALAGNRGAAGLKFAFRYFQTLETDLSLPDGFAPSRVVVRLIPGDRNAEAHEESFPWAPRGT
jgi:hypothetical protein